MGIGFQITKKLLSDKLSGSVDTVLLIATEPGRPVYEKAGFRTVTEYLYFQRDNPWKDYQVSSNIIPYNESHYAILMGLDTQISGEGRKALLEDFMGNTLVYIENNSVKGFYMPDLGEGLIFALAENAGLELMKVKYSKADKAVLPSDNLPGTDFLSKHGFKLTDTRGTRMILGQDIDWKPKNVFSRIGGNYG